MISPTIVWFRRDLRLADNPALMDGVERGGAVLPVFVWAPEEEGDWPPGAASRWWLHRSLEALAAELEAVGSRLVIRRGPSAEALAELASDAGARAVVWNRLYEPEVLARDARVKRALEERDLLTGDFNAALLHEPWTIANRQGKPFQVFTPFWRHCLSLPDPPAAGGVPAAIRAPTRWPASLSPADLRLLPTVDWVAGMRATWRPGRIGAVAQWRRFLRGAVDAYPADRDRPDRVGTSRLSPHLHFGEISPREIWWALKARASRRSPQGGDGDWRRSVFLRELGWREFAHHLLHHFPRTPGVPLRGEFARFPWRTDPGALAAWQQGKTGYPVVDAGMRELWATGWMHNRLRMVVASFLVKDLMVSWWEGARWFWDTLVDADLAQNTLGWQWTAGCGADAAPFFRIFNPTSQGEKFDPEGTYTRRWVPELARVPSPWIHRPSEAPAGVLAQAGVELDKDYPSPMVSHAIARNVALDAYRRLRS